MTADDVKLAGIIEVGAAKTLDLLDSPTDHDTNFGQLYADARDLASSELDRVVAYSPSPCIESAVTAYRDALADLEQLGREGWIGTQDGVIGDWAVPAKDIGQRITKANAQVAASLCVSTASRRSDCRSVPSRSPSSRLSGSARRHGSLTTRSSTNRCCRWAHISTSSKDPWLAPATGGTASSSRRTGRWRTVSAKAGSHRPTTTGRPGSTGSSIQTQVRHGRVAQRTAPSR